MFVYKSWHVAPIGKGSWEKQRTWCQHEHPETLRRPPAQRGRARMEGRRRCAKAQDQGTKEGVWCATAHGAEIRRKEEPRPSVPACPLPVGSLLRDPPHTHARLACHKQKSSEPCPPSPESRTPIFLISSPSEREENRNEHRYLLSLRKSCAPVSDNTLFPLLRGHL